MLVPERQRYQRCEECDQSSTITIPSVSSDFPEIKKLKETDKGIQEGLAIIVEASKERSNIIKENIERNSAFSEKDDKFSGISNHIYKLSASSTGNQIYRVAKRAEIDSAISELDVKNSSTCVQLVFNCSTCVQLCSTCVELVFNEEKCIEFNNEHKTVILQIACQIFSRSLSIYSKKTQTEVVKVVKSDYAKCNKLTFVTRDENEKQKLISGRGIIDDNGEGAKNETVRDAHDEDKGHVRTGERVSLDLTHSYVFSIFRRLEQPVYYALVKNARDKRCPSKLKDRAINPQLDSSVEYAESNKVINDTLDVMLSMSPESFFTNLTRLLDIDSTVLKGDKAAIRDSGSPAKTRTMVSFLGFAENMLRLIISILREKGIDPNNMYLKKSALLLERQGSVDRVFDRVALKRLVASELNGLAVSETMEEEGEDDKERDSGGCSIKKPTTGKIPLPLPLPVKASSKNNQNVENAATKHDNVIEKLVLLDYGHEASRYLRERSERIYEHRS
ncbi:hypothetical protein O3P69_019053 [Scylla paramamosain]|uniref:Uncharacterized protein n=1 Tax=Scylla paramamosain TaxID=85552 RepID=A0AAW0T906_SCYPA